MEEFAFHWKRITNYYIETSDEKEPVSKTNIPDHLLQMLHILVMEETEMIEEFGSAADQTGIDFHFKWHTFISNRYFIKTFDFDESYQPFLVIRQNINRMNLNLKFRDVIQKYLKKV